MTITPEHLDRLLELAEKATSGPWKSRKSVHGNKYRIVQFDKGPLETAMYTSSELEPGDANLIAALDPETVKALVAMATGGK